MDPTLKLVLEEIHKSKDDINSRFDEHYAQWERRFANLELDRAARTAAVDKQLDALESAYADTSTDIGQHVTNLEAVRFDQIHAERDDRVAALETAATELGSWHPEVDALVDDLKLEVKKLS